GLSPRPSRCSPVRQGQTRQLVRAAALPARLVLLPRAVRVVQPNAISARCSEPLELLASQPRRRCRPATPSCPTDLCLLALQPPSTGPLPRGLGQTPAPACGCHVRLQASPAERLCSRWKACGSVLSSKLTSSDARDVNLQQEERTMNNERQ